MISTPTCLVLGAGASIDSGFPTGRELINYVQAQLNRREALQSADGLFSYVRQTTGASNQEVQGFAARLRRSRVPSIDFYLEANPDHIEIGKAAIAAALMPWEDEARMLFDSKPSPGTWLAANTRLPEVDLFLKQHWYDDLWHAMMDECPDASSFLTKNQLSVITFNYDRSLEHYLSRSFGHMYPQADNVELFKVVRIIHMHGELG